MTEVGISLHAANKKYINLYYILQENTFEIH